MQITSLEIANLRIVEQLDLSPGPGLNFIQGPNGAGKTTTIRVILGLLRRSGGQSTILGYDSMRDTYAIRERVGYIAQQFALPPDMTVMENMRFFANVHGVSSKKRRRSSCASSCRPMSSRIRWRRRSRGGFRWRARS